MYISALPDNRLISSKPESPQSAIITFFSFLHNYTITYIWRLKKYIFEQSKTKCTQPHILGYMFIISRKNMFPVWVISFLPVLNSTLLPHCSAAIIPLNSAGDRQIVTFRINSKTDMHISQVKVIIAINQLAVIPNIRSKGSNGSG